MNNLLKLKTDLENRAAADLEANSDNYIEGEFTEEDQAAIDAMKEETKQEVIMVAETAPDGTTVETAISEYAKSLDEKVATIMDEDGNARVIKTLNSGEIQQSVESLKAKAKEQALNAYRSLAIKDSDTHTDEDYIEINNRAIQALIDYFKCDKLISDVIISKLNKMTLKQIAAILPQDFVEIYLSPNEIQFNNLKAKERFLTVIGYLTITGPELDYLNEYIEDENKLAMVSQRLLRCQMDFADMLKDERNLSELVAKTIEIAPNDASFWSKYIKLPNRVSNEFAQRAVLQKQYKEAYAKILDEYPESDDPKENRFNEKARAIIQAEVDEAAAKEEVYISISNLDLFHTLYKTLEARYMAHTKLTHKFLIKEVQSAIERARRCKQNVSYPGYGPNMTRTEQIYKAYMTAYPQMITNYNNTICGVYKKESEVNPDLMPENPIMIIGLENRPEESVIKVFSALLAIMMGRVMKACTENNATKYDAIVLDSYFQIFCKLGTDIYLMNDVWMTMKPLVIYIMDHVKLDQRW